MNKQQLRKLVKTEGAWAKANSASDMAHFFLSKHDISYIAISKCFRRVAILAELAIPEDAVRCKTCEAFLQLKREVDENEK